MKLLLAAIAFTASACVVHLPPNGQVVPMGYELHVEKCEDGKQLVGGSCVEIYCYDEETPLPPSFETFSGKEAEGRFCMWRQAY